jgi:WRKY transcription factor 2
MSLKIYSLQEYGAHLQNQSLSNIHRQESSLQSSFTAVKDNTNATIVKAKASDSMFGNSHYSAGQQQDDETNQNAQGKGVEIRAAACVPASTHCDTSLMESQDAVDVSSTLSNEEDERATHGTASIECEGDEDETESKRRLILSTT